MGYEKHRCFQNAYELAYDLIRENAEHVAFGFVVCHGLATATAGPDIGARYGHAWVEMVVDGRSVFVYDFCLDKPLCCQKRDYYRIGQVKKLASYSVTEVLENVLRTHHFGPWVEYPADTVFMED